MDCSRRRVHSFLSHHAPGETPLIDSLPLTAPCLYYRGPLSSFRVDRMSLPEAPKSSAKRATSSAQCAGAKRERIVEEIFGSNLIFSAKVLVCDRYYLRREHSEAAWRR